MIVSVIVPVYNVQDFLEKCINSIYKQDINTTDYEIVAVNDGSTDNSLNVLKELQKKIDNLVIINQENKGLSGARNSGFKAAKGEYILCVDSDDYIVPNTLRHITSLSKMHNLDILEFGANGVDENDNITYTSIGSSNGKVMSGEEYLSKIEYLGSACNKLYKTDFIRKHDLQFMEGVYIEDIEFNTKAVFKSERILATDFIVGHFLQRLGSITRSANFNKKKKMIFDIHKVLTSINDFTESQVGTNSIAYIPLKKRVSSLISTMLLRVLKDCKTTDIKKTIITQLKQQELYPTKYKANTKQKQLFLSFANIEILFSISCNLFCFYNSLRNEK